MIRANRLFLALALCAHSSACGLIFDTDAQGPQVCGNGCVEQGEACDDANDIAEDGCNACQCALP